MPSARLASFRWLWPVLALHLAFIVVELRGVDFGYQWDEDKMLEPARLTATTGVLLQRSEYDHHAYIYPNMGWLVSLAAAAPELVRSLVPGAPDGLARAAMEDRFAYRLRVRALFIVLVSFSVPILVALVRAAGRSRAEAIGAAALLATSWEVSYHARWIVADPLMMMWSSLAMLLLLLSLRRGVRFVWWAAFVAGLAVSTKYTTAVLLPICLLAAWWQRGPQGIVRPALVTVASFAAGFLIITPAPLIDTQAWWEGTSFALRTYGSGGWFGYTVSGPLEWIGKAGAWAVLCAFSWFAPLAVVFALLALVGLVQTARDAPTQRASLLLIAFPALFVGMLATQKVLAVRNFMSVAPLAALFAARGAALLVERLATRRERGVLVALLVLLVGVDGAFVVYAAESIRDRRTDRFEREAAAWVDAQPERAFLASPKVLKAFERQGQPPRVNVHAALAEDPRIDLVLVFASEAMPVDEWPANELGLTVKDFGPLDVNFNMYPSWLGDDRILVFDLATARTAGVRIVSQAP